MQYGLLFTLPWQHILSKLAIPDASLVYWSFFSQFENSSNLARFSLMIWAWTAAKTPQGPPLCWTNPNLTLSENPKDWLIQPEGRGKVVEPKTNCFKEQAVSKLMGVSLMPFIASDCLKREEKAFEVHSPNYVITYLLSLKRFCHGCSARFIGSIEIHFFKGDLYSLW